MAAHVTVDILGVYDVIAETPRNQRELTDILIYRLPRKVLR